MIICGIFLIIRVEKKEQKFIFSQINVIVKEKVVLLRPQNKSISINHLKEGSVLK